MFDLKTPGGDALSKKCSGQTRILSDRDLRCHHHRRCKENEARWQDVLASHDLARMLEALRNNFSIMNIQTIRTDWLLKFGFCVMLGLVQFGRVPSAHGQVVFDVNALVPAWNVEQYGMMARLPNSRFVEVQLETSALFQAGSAANVSEVTVRVHSRHEDVVVADFSPRTEMQTDVFGPMQVAVDTSRMQEAGLQGLGGYPGVGSASGFAYHMDSGNQSIQFARKPAMELLTASGTLDRHRGVYFKMRQSSQMTLEGARQFRIVFEVPESWRADLLDVTIEAVGTENSKARRTTVLSSQPFVVAVYQNGDEVASRAAANYRKQQASLVNVARAHAWTIEHRSYPTPLHKLGAKLDIYEPEIPRGWYEALVYRPGVAYHISKLSPLPVDVRVAVMNFLDQKTRIESLSGTKDGSSGPAGSSMAQTPTASELARR